ncbi:hypothetical protein PXH59_03140 [Xenorhabdus sp. SF857]|nr:hypothetical protein [Xenorhabdus sp. SF857]WFQ80184.1 hypothetical protein PXH59_03140 [Xenorhabdus sp. SF857]
MWDDKEGYVNGASVLLDVDISDILPQRSLVNGAIVTVLSAEIRHKR